MQCHQVGQLIGDQGVFAEFQARVGLFLHGGQSLFRQPGGGGARELLVAEVGVRGTAPDGQRLAQQCGAGPGSGDRPRAGEQFLEAVGVDRAGGGQQLVPRRARDEKRPPARLGALQRAP